MREGTKEPLVRSELFHIVNLAGDFHKAKARIKVGTDRVLLKRLDFRAFHSLLAEMFQEVVDETASNASVLGAG